MNVTNLESVIFGVDDLESCRRFWTDFGLTESELNGAPCFTCQDGSGVVLRRIDDPGLPAAVEPGATLREAVFGVRSSADLDAIAAELDKDRPVSVDTEGTVHAVDPLGFPIAFRVSRRKNVAAPPLKVDVSMTEP